MCVCVCVFVFIVNIFFLLCQITTTMQKYHQSLLRTSYYGSTIAKTKRWPFAERERERERIMSQQSSPDLKQYMDKKLSIKLNGKRSVTGVLRGFDQFMNLVLDAAIEETGTQSNKIGTIVRVLFKFSLLSYSFSFRVTCTYTSV